MASPEKQLGTAPAGLEAGWNELGFLPWRSFRRMAPSILRLEITRLGELIEGARSMEVRNAAVKARYELELFVADLIRCEDDALGLDTGHLEKAILNLPVQYPGMDEKTNPTLAYILDRLQYVHNRIRFVYQ